MWNPQNFLWRIVLPRTMVYQHSVQNWRYSALILPSIEHNDSTSSSNQDQTQTAMLPVGTGCGFRCELCGGVGCRLGRGIVIIVNETAPLQIHYDELAEVQLGKEVENCSIFMNRKDRCWRGKGSSFHNTPNRRKEPFLASNPRSGPHIHSETMGPDWDRQTDVDGNSANIPAEILCIDDGPMQNPLADRNGLGTS